MRTCCMVTFVHVCMHGLWKDESLDESLFLSFLSPYILFLFLFTKFPMDAYK
jgi:hypothetical protein